MSEVISQFLTNLCQERGWKLHNREINYRLVHKVSQLDSNDLTPEIQEYLEGHLGTRWLQDTFNSPVVLIFDESITDQHLYLLHQYLRQSACNIENIILVASSNLGVSDWWSSLNRLNGEKTFKIVEYPLYGEWFEKYFLTQNSSVDIKWLRNKKPTNLFGFLGGKNQHPEREFLYLWLKSMNFSDAIISYACPNFNEKSVLEGWIEKHSYYMNQYLVDSTMSCYPENWAGVEINNFDTRKKDFFGVDTHTFDKDGMFAELNKTTWLNIARESHNNLPFRICTEKTVMPLIYGSVPIGLAFRHDLSWKQLGLEVPELPVEMLDCYRIPGFIDRMLAIGKKLGELAAIHYEQRIAHYELNLPFYEKNIDWVFSGDMRSHLKKRLVDQCDQLHI